MKSKTEGGEGLGTKLRNCKGRKVGWVYCGRREDGKGGGGRGGGNGERRRGKEGGFPPPITTAAITKRKLQVPYFICK